MGRLGIYREGSVLGGALGNVWITGSVMAKRPTSLPAALVVVGCIAWILAPAAIVAALTARAGSIELAHDVTVWVDVEENTGQLSRPIELQLTWQHVTPLVAPAWQGTVQAVGLAAGASFANGGVAAVIDGVSRIGWASTRPFYRPLALEDSGSDVSDLNAMLAGMGLDADSGDEVGYSTLAGIREFAASIGVVDARWVEQFDPGWVVFLPAATVNVGEVDLAVGGPAPQAGGTLAQLDARLASAVLVRPGSGGDGGDEDEEAADQEPGHPLTADPGDLLSLAGETLELAADRDRVADAALDATSRLVADEAATVGARLVRPAEPDEWVVPAAAIVAATYGGTCVISGTEAHPVPVPVTVVGSDLGRAVVTGELGTGVRVIVRPEAGVRRCA
jgi:hypothetical protein